MKKIIVAFLSFLTLALMVSAFSACDFFNTKKDQNGPSSFQYEAGADYIKITEIGGHQFGDQFNSHEYKLDEGEWQSKAEFTSLSPNTEYIVSVRFGEDDRYKASEAYSQTVTTLKYEQTKPEVSLTQENKIIRFEENTALEFSYDGGNMYTSGNEHTYTENGKYTIKVRYKETDQKYHSEEQTLTVTISDFYSGEGTRENPYLIKTVDNFLKMNTGGHYYKLLEDLDFRGTVLSGAKHCKHFDGNGKKLKNVTLVSDTTDISIFDSATDTIENLTVENAVVDFTAEQNEKTEVYTISLLARSSNYVTNCHVSGTINVRDDYSNVYWIGGIISYGVVDISDCSVDIKATINANNELYFGGIAGFGYSKNKIFNSRANVDFNITGSFIGKVGGLSGYLSGGLIKDCMATGEIILNGFPRGLYIVYVGGIAGGTVKCKNCVSFVSIGANGSNQNVKVGGIIGQTSEYDEIENCLSVGMLAVTMDGTKKCACDSIIGELAEGAIFNNCYHMEDVALGATTEYSTAVTEETAKSLAWQKEVLGLDENIWNLKDGEYPTLR